MLQGDMIEKVSFWGLNFVDVYVGFRICFCR